MWKGYFTIVLSILLVLVCFTGCRSDSSEDLSVDLPSSSVSSGDRSGNSDNGSSSSEETDSSAPDETSENSSETGTAGDSPAVSGHVGGTSENNSGTTTASGSGTASHDASTGSVGSTGTSAGSPTLSSGGTSSSGSGTGNASTSGGGNSGSSRTGGTNSGNESSGGGTGSTNHSPALPYSEVTAGTILTVSGAGVSRPYYFTLADLQSMTAAITEADYFSRGKDKPGETAEMTTHFKGIRVSYLIHDVMGIESSKKVKFLASDGYSATYSTSGIDSTYLNEMVPGASLYMLLAWEEDYQPCNLHLCMGQTVAGEYNRQHWVKDVISIEVK